jgi:hypothetical protein
VQRATTGRRHTRVGSITVAELIRKQPGPVRIPSFDEADTDLLVTELLGTHVDPDDELEFAAGRASKAGKVARFAGIATGVAVLGASVVAATVFAGTRPTRHQDAPLTPPLQITGVSALRPDVLDAQLGPDQPAAAAPLTSAVGPTGSLAPAPDAGPGNAPDSPPAAASSVRLPAGGPDAVRAVRQFYDLVLSQPGAALQLVDPALLGGDPRGLAQAWREVRGIQVDSVVQRPDRSVLATVVFRQVDGHAVRVEQLFWLTEGAAPRITNSEILSAQRS